MAHEYRPGQIVAESGVYRITHDPEHTDMPNEVLLLKDSRFPGCRHCISLSFALVYAAKHATEVPELQPPDDAPAEPEGTR